MSKVESENFMKRHPFEPDPGSVGMGPDQLIEAGLARPEDVTTVGAYTELLGLAKGVALIFWRGVGGAKGVVEGRKGSLLSFGAVCEI